MLKRWCCRNKRRNLKLGNLWMIDGDDDDDEYNTAHDDDDDSFNLVCSKAQCQSTSSPSSSDPPHFSEAVIPL